MKSRKKQVKLEPITEEERDRLVREYRERGGTINALPTGANSGNLQFRDHAKFKRTVSDIYDSAKESKQTGDEEYD